ncbi:hypothetical protein ACJRO7_007503 [Eucalyptus globulus]|uniref:Uncharacterized protein n=1 Tax=Eucalyptus globulus TaxID=34317 RepID=A0ABD3IP95_EUCGL
MSMSGDKCPGPARATRAPPFLNLALVHRPKIPHEDKTPPRGATKPPHHLRKVASGNAAPSASSSQLLPNAQDRSCWRETVQRERGRHQGSFSSNISTSVITIEEVLHRKNDNSQMEQRVGSTQSELHVKDGSNDVHSSAGNSIPFNTKDNKEGEDATRGTRLVDIETSGDVNMEASISPDDVARAGGLGARDDISSFLPVASDSTEFEGALLKARDYEGPQGDVSRPGLGWTEGTH